MLTSTQPLVSIVVPCFRGEAFLGDALDSCLAQTYGNFEVIVVDDASPDRCAEIAETYSARDARITVLRHPQNGGVSRAFNTGFRQARGPLLGRLAQDDVFLPTALEVMVRTMEDNPQAGLVYCDMTLTDEHLNPVEEWVTPAPQETLTEHNYLGLCVLWRREMWDRCGEFDPEFDAAEDFEYWLRAIQHFAFVRCDTGSQFLMRRHSEAGSFTLFAKQTVAMAEARCRHALPRREWSETLSRAYFDAAWIHRIHGRKRDALYCAWKALRYTPGRLRCWRAVLANTLRAGVTP